MVTVNASLALPQLTNQAYTISTTISGLALPEATGGTGPLTYALTGSQGAALPVGLSFNANTRTLSGTPTAVGTSTLTYTVTDANGASTSRSFTVTVNREFADLNNAVLPEVARALADQTVSAITQRIDQARSGGGPGPSLLADSPHWPGRHLPTARPLPMAR